MKLHTKGQSVSEYAIILGLVIAVAAGVSQVLLKGALRQKQEKAVNYLLNAGSAQLTTSITQKPIYNQEVRQTKITANKFIDQTVTQKGGGELKMQRQEQVSPSTSIETLNAVTK
jgi:hypothetical protein